MQFHNSTRQNAQYLDVNTLHAEEVIASHTYVPLFESTLFCPCEEKYVFIFESSQRAKKKKKKNNNVFTKRVPLTKQQQ